VFDESARPSVSTLCTPTTLLLAGRAHSGPWASHGGSIQMHPESV